MNWAKTLQDLLDGTASEDEIHLLRQALVSGEISIGGNVNQSVIIIGSGNTVELTPAALDRLNARPMLGNLDRDLTGEEIASGLRRLDKLLPNRAPVLLPHYKEQVGRLRPTLKTEVKALSETSRKERLEALATINSICVEAVDVSFNGLALGEAAPDYDARSPFRGLESFRPEDSEFFFGREALTRKLVAQIQAHPFLAVLGASGSGKSSLVMAGVIPALDSDYVIFRPGMSPLGELESARGKALIVVDQFEELFTLTRDESTREEFIARLLDESTRARIILTLRSDFLGEVGAYRTLSAEIQNHLEIVPPMNMDELRRAMEGQAGVVGLRFEADLSQQILDDVAGEPGAMPLLQHALWELWNRRHGRNLRASEYRAFGRVKQAITSTAEKIYADCSKPEQDALRDIFLRLTRLDEGDEGRDTRRRVSFDDLIPFGRDAASITLLLDKLANARLIVKTVNADKTEVEVAHEALIRHWDRLRLWLNEDRNALRLRESVSEDARRWEHAGRDEALLNHRGGRLDDALSLGEDSRYGATEIEKAYLNACVALRNKEQRERERRLRYTVIASVTVAIILLALGSFGLVKNNELELAKTTVERQSARLSVFLAQQLFINRSSKQTTAVLLAIHSMRVYPTDEAALLLKNNTAAYLVAGFTQGAIVDKVVFSPDGKYVAASGGNIVRIWESITGKEVASMKHNDLVYSISFSPNGKYIISGCRDQNAHIWQISTAEEVYTQPFDGNVYSVAFSANGKYAAAGGDKAILIWAMETSTEVIHINTSAAPIYFVIFSPDNNYLAVGDSKTASVWDIATGSEVAQMDHGQSVSSIAFSHDGKYIVTGSEDHTARVWETATGREISRTTHLDSVQSVAFSPDGKYVISGSRDNTARVWEAITGEEISRMTHDGSVHSVAFSSSGKYVVSGGNDFTARLWIATTGKEIARVTHESWVTSVAFSPDDHYVASGGNDKSIYVWKVAIPNNTPYSNPEGLIADACSRVTRNLTRAEWNQYIGDTLSYQAVCPNLPIEAESIPTP